MASAWTDFEVAEFFGVLGTPLQTNPSSALSTGGAITTIAVAALPAALATNSPILLTSGTNTQWWLLTAPAALSATSVTVASQTPNFAYPTSTVITSPVWPLGSLYLGMHYANPALGGVGSAEFTGGSYARQLLTLSTVNSRAVYNTNAILFTGLLASTVAYLGIWDSSAAGNLLGYAQVLPTVTIVGGGQFPVNVGDLALSF